MASEQQVKVGCCGFRLRQSEYVREFPIVEVQHTFYQPPRVETLARWRADAPDDFEFIVKAWMLVTHDAATPTYRRLKRSLTDEEREGAGSFQDSPIVREAWAATLEAARTLRARRILLQCPARFTPTDEHLDQLQFFITSIAAGTGLEYLWEPRGGWPDELVRAVCEDLHLTHVVDPFSARTVTPERTYFRIHGRRGLLYEDEELEALLEVLPSAGTSYVLFNNVRMLHDARRFRVILERAGVPSA